MQTKRFVTLTFVLATLVSLTSCCTPQKSKKKKEKEKIENEHNEALNQEEKENLIG